MIYRIKLTNHLRIFRSLFFAAVIMVGIISMLKFEESAKIIFGIFFLLDAIPAMYLHIEYWLFNKKLEFKLTSDAIIKIVDNIETRYKSEDIEKIVVYKSASMDKGGMPFLAIESYYYARIVLKSGDEFILTRLLIPELDKVITSLKGVNVVRKKRLFCTVFWK